MRIHTYKGGKLDYSNNSRWFRDTPMATLIAGISETALKLN
jgi:hypothetical protein